MSGPIDLDEVHRRHVPGVRNRFAYAEGLLLADTFREAARRTA
ncbi:hypothetical protein [Modestobacter sp. SYSU DS0875]